MHYLNHANHSWPKPPSVYQAMDLDVEKLSPAQKQRVIDEARFALAELLYCPDSSTITFTTSVGEALNQAIHSLPWQAGDGIVISALEHQALLSSVLHLARTKGVQVYIVPYTPEVPFDMAECETLLKAHSKIRLIAVSHASSVIGCVLPVTEIVRLAKRYGKRGLVDASLTAGLLPLNLEHDGMDWLVLSDDKALQGPSGVHVLIARQSDCVESGFQDLHSLSMQERMQGQPSIEKLAAFTEGIHWVQLMGFHAIQRHADKLLARLQNGLGEIPEVTVYGALEPPFQLPVLSFNVLGYQPEALAKRLFQEFGIWVQAGFHDSRLSHEAIGSIHRGGTVRVSMGYQSRPEDVDALVNAVKATLVGTQGAWALIT